jgi:hypothetical protein
MPASQPEIALSELGGVSVRGFDGSRELTDRL